MNMVSQWVIQAIDAVPSNVDDVTYCRAVARALQAFLLGHSFMRAVQIGRANLISGNVIPLHCPRRVTLSPPMPPSAA